MHKVSLARAVYSRASILLLDDVLSAGRHYLFFVLITDPIESQSTLILPITFGTTASKAN